MPALLFLVAISLPPPAAALSSADEWSDFADNFATDLAPLITLFGEQVTKQFLSESTSFLDNVIFGMAPLGIITAVVSAIRLYGRASLKSFIGRAQEAHGVAEAELCSSTSHDVCEMWSNGGICRVFGKPRILEFIYTKGGDFYPTEFADEGQPPHCGIYPANEVLVRQTLDGSSDRWTEVGGSAANLIRRFGDMPSWFAPYPNLSLNVGTQRTKRPVLLAAAAGGVLLQASFFLYATWATFYNPSFYADDDPPQMWSYVLGMVGTLLLVCGMTLCAALVERRSTERRFAVVPKPDGVKPRLYWLQCGDQRVGDQQFRSFAYFKEKSEYTTSFLLVSDLSHVFGLRPSFPLLAAITLSLLGFSCQFVGLRGLHGSIALYQLACTLFMSIVRALLRSRRLRRDQNLLEDFRRKSDSDELDWQALNIAQDETSADPGPRRRPREDIWRLTCSHVGTGLRHSASSQAADFAKTMGVEILVSEGKVGSGLVGFRPARSSQQQGVEKESSCAHSAVHFVRIREGDVQCDGSTVAVLTSFASTADSATRPPDSPPRLSFNPAARAVYVRARLGYLTGDPLQPPGLQWDPELQAVARRLQAALQDAAAYIFRETPPLREGGWEHAKALTWSAACQYHTADEWESNQSMVFPIHFVLRQQRRRWLISEHQLAAVMSLWRYGMLRAIGIPTSSQANMDPKRKVIRAVGGRDRTAAVVRLWVARETLLEHRIATRDGSGGVELASCPLSAEESLQARFYLWEPYDEAEGAAAEPDATEVPKTSLLSIPTAATLLEIMAQDIFATFVFEAAAVVDQLIDVAVRQPPSSSSDGILRGSTATSSDLSNAHIDALARILCESGLATEEAALMSVVSAFFYHSKLPSVDASVAKLLGDAKNMKRDRQFEQGEAHLKSMLRICSAEHQEKVVRALGELYREAARSPSELHRDFGLRAMASLKDLTTPAGTALSPAAAAALRDYQELSDFLNSDPSRRGKPWEQKPRPPLDMASVEELRLDMDRPRDQRSRSRALLMLEKYNIGGRSSPAAQEFLFVAVSLGYVEVVEDLRAANPALVYEAPAPYRPFDAEDDWTMTTLVKNRFGLGGTLPFLRSAGEEAYLRPGPTVGFLAIAWATSQLEDEGRQPGDEADDVLRAVLDWAMPIKDFTDAQGNTPLMQAVSAGNHAAVDILLEYGLDFQVRNTAGETVLSLAIAKGHRSIAEKILVHGQGAGGLPPRHLHEALSLALRSREREFIELLLRHGADINGRDEQGMTLLQAAMEHFPLDPQTGQHRKKRRGPLGEADPVFVALLLEYGASVEEDFLPTVLQAAIDLSQLDWIHRLHAHDHAVVVQFFEGKDTLKAVLEAAISRGGQDERRRAESLTKLLLDIGVAVRPGVLHRAVRLRLPSDMLATVLEKGSAWVNDVEKDYGTPLQTLLNNDFWAGTAAEQEAMLEMLVAAGCDVNLDSTEWKATPLQIACARSEFYHEEPVIYHHGPARPEYSDHLAAILVRRGADVNLTAADIPGEGRRLIRSTPLELACLTGKTELVRALLMAGARVSTAGGEFGPPLQAASMRFGQRRASDSGVDIVRALLAAGADVNAVARPCGTALAAAAHWLLPEVVKVLLEAGAKPSLEVFDLAQGEYQDAWDAVQEPHGQLAGRLRAAFTAMQTGPFMCATIRYQTSAAREAREEIKNLLAQHGDMPPAARYESICVQDAYTRLSPEEIRWRHRLRPGGDATIPDPEDPATAPLDLLPFLEPAELDGGIGTIAVQHICSQYPYHEYSVEEIRAWDYAAGRRYGLRPGLPAGEGQEMSETPLSGAGDVSSAAPSLFDSNLVPSIFDTSSERRGFGTFLGRHHTERVWGGPSLDLEAASFDAVGARGGGFGTHAAPRGFGTGFGQVKLFGADVGRPVRGALGSNSGARGEPSGQNSSGSSAVRGSLFGSDKQGGLFGLGSTGSLFGSNQRGGLFQPTEGSGTDFPGVDLIGGESSRGELFGSTGTWLRMPFETSSAYGGPLESTPNSGAGLFRPNLTQAGLFGSSGTSSTKRFGADASHGGLSWPTGSGGRSLFGASSAPGRPFGVTGESGGGLSNSSASQGGLLDTTASSATSLPELETPGPHLSSSGQTFGHDLAAGAISRANPGPSMESDSGQGGYSGGGLFGLDSVPTGPSKHMAEQTDWGDASAPAPTEDLADAPEASS